MPHSTTEGPANGTSPVVTKTIDGVEIPIYPLQTIDYGLLLKGDATEKDRLSNASRYPGFFHLDFQSESSKEIHNDLYAVYDLEKKYFAEHEDANKFKDIEVSDLFHVHIASASPKVVPAGSLSSMSRFVLRRTIKAVHSSPCCRLVYP